jgi:PAS domain S-box-containing protein
MTAFLQASRRPGLRAGIIAFALLVAGAFWMTAALLAGDDRVRTLAQIDGQNANLARTLAGHAARTLDYADRVALEAKAAHERAGHGFDLGRYFRDGRIDGKVVRGMVIVDAHGNVRQMSQAGGQAANIADREHFKFHAQADNGTADISRPLKSRVWDGVGIFLSRRLNRPDGAFDGIVSVAINPEIFTGFYRELGLGEQGLVVLTGLDGYIRARNSNDGAGIGQDVRGSGLFNEASTHDSGIARYQAKIDGVMRRAAYRRLDRYPMIMNVGVAEDAALAAYHFRERALYSGAAVASLLSLFAAAALLVALRRRERDALALADSGERFRQVTEHIGDVFRLTDAATQQLLYVSPAYERVWGRSVASLYRAPLDWIEGVHPEDRERVRHAAGTRQITGEFDEQYRVVRPDDAQRWVRERAFPVRDATGAVVRIAGIAEDVTELRELEQAYRRVIEASPDATFINRDDAIRYANPAALKMLRAKSAAEVVGRSPLDFVHPDDREAARARINRQRRGEQMPGLYEQGFVALDGSLVHTEVSSSLTLDQGQLARQVVARDITRRKEIETALIESEARYRRLVEGSPDATFIMRGETTLYANPAALRLLGAAAADQVIGASAYQHLHPDYVAAARVRAARLEAGEFAAGEIVERQYVRFDGRVIDVEVSNARVQLADGVARQVIARDVSARKRVEAALRDSEARYRGLIEASPDSVFIYEDDKINFVNPAGIALLGASAATQIVGRRMLDFIPGPGHAAALARREYVKTTGQPSGVFEQTYRRLDGSLIEVEGNIMPVAGSGERMSIVRDVSARKGLEAAMRESERALADSQRRRDALLESVPDPVWMKDCNGRFIAANRAWFARLGVAPHDVAHKIDTDFFSAERAAELGAEDRRVIETGAVVRKERNWQFADHVEWIETVKSPVKDAAGNVGAIIGVSHDITERKRGEQALQALNESLALKSSELAALNNELEAFAYSVSHDLRAPLRQITGFGQFLLKDSYDALDPEGRGRLKRILAASERMNGLIDDLLTLSRVSRQSMARRKVKLSALAAEAAATLAEANPGRRVEVAIEPGLTADADPGLMRVVLDNLIGNAWKFTGRRTDARIEVATTIVDGKHAYFVRDNGAGFDMEFAGKLFTPFQRMHTKDEFDGTGIGLATVNRIVTRHAGRVWIDSAVERGTTVYFTLGEAS